MSGGVDGALGDLSRCTRLVVSVYHSLFCSNTKSGDKDEPNFQLVTFHFVITNKKGVIKSYWITGNSGAVFQYPYYPYSLYYVGRSNSNKIILVFIAFYSYYA